MLAANKTRNQEEQAAEKKKKATKPGDGKTKFNSDEEQLGLTNRWIAAPGGFRMDCGQPGVGADPQTFGGR